MPCLLRPVLRVWLTVALWSSSTLLGCDANVFGLLVDWKTICEPNFKLCPNNGLAFRDRMHNCEYPPCELVAPGPPPPPPTDRDSLEVSKWFGKRDFVVPVLNISIIRKGQHAQQKWLEAQREKEAQVLNASQASHIQGFIDLYVVPRAPSDPFLAARFRALGLHVTSLITSTNSTTSPSSQEPESTGSGSSSGNDAGDEDPERPLAEPLKAVSHPPWSHWELFGQIASGVATTESVQTALKLLRLRIQNETQVNKTVIKTPTTAFVTLVVDAAAESELEEDANAMTQLLLQCENLTRTGSTEAAAVDASVRVFTTDLRRHDDDQSHQNSWNVTRIACGESVANTTSRTSSSSSSGSSHSGSGAGSSSVVVLKRPPATNSSVGGGSSQASSCSCWTRSSKATGIDAGDDLGEEDEPEASLTWMLCA